MVLSYKKRIISGRFLLYGILIVLSLIVFFPFFWMFSTSFKTIAEALRIPITWIPLKPTFKNYVDMWLIKPFGLYFKSSIIISGGTAVLSTLLGAFAGYGISRFVFKGRRFILGCFLSTQMISGVLVIGPYFRIMAQLNLYNTYAGMIIAYVTICLPFATWMLKGFFDTIPKQIDEAAIIDGASRLRTCVEIIMPLAMPGMVATLLFGFLLAWSDLLWVISLTSTDAVRTVTLGIAFSVGDFLVNWPMLTAAAIIGSVPSIAFYVFLQRFLVAGITAGAVKQ